MVCMRTLDNPQKYPTITLTMRPEIRVRLEAMATLLQTPAWRVVDSALSQYLFHMSEAEKTAVENFALQTMARGSVVTSAAHKATAKVELPFADAWQALEEHGPIHLTTKSGKEFEASARTAKGDRRVIRYFQNGKEYGRAYECCWPHRTNCNRTWIGLYSEPLDQFLRSLTGQS